MEIAGSANVTTLKLLLNTFQDGHWTATLNN